MHEESWMQMKDKGCFKNASWGIHLPQYNMSLQGSFSNGKGENPKTYLKAILNMQSSTPTI